MHWIQGFIRASRELLKHPMDHRIRDRTDPAIVIWSCQVTMNGMKSKCFFEKNYWKNM